MSTITTIELAKEVGLTPKSIRTAVHRGDLRATRISKGRGHTASATEFVIQRSEADDWKARRAEKRGRGMSYPNIIEDQAQRRQANQGSDVEQLTRAALAGLTQAKMQLRKPWEEGGISLVRWWNRDVGEVV